MVWGNNVFSFLYLKILNVSSLFSCVSSLFQACHVGKNQPFLVESILPDWLEKVHVFHRPLDLLLNPTLFYDTYTNQLHAYMPRSYS